MTGCIGADATCVTVRIPFPLTVFATVLRLLASGILIALVITILNISNNRFQRDGLLHG